jgi:hypothetical protein
MKRAKPAAAPAALIAALEAALSEAAERRWWKCSDILEAAQAAHHAKPRANTKQQGLWSGINSAIATLKDPPRSGVPARVIQAHLAAALSAATAPAPKSAE